jgi:hypothetical protein
MNIDCIDPVIAKWLVWLLPLVIWDAAWKVVSLWKSAGNKQLVWFIFLAFVNSLGILPIIYIFFFQKKKGN